MNMKINNYIKDKTDIIIEDPIDKYMKNEITAKQVVYTLLEGLGS